MRLAFWRRRKATRPYVLITPAPAFVERELIEQQAGTRDRRERTRRYRFLALALVLGTVVWQLAEDRKPVRVVAPAPTRVAVPPSSVAPESTLPSVSPAADSHAIHPATGQSKPVQPELEQPELTPPQAVDNGIPNPPVSSDGSKSNSETEGSCEWVEPFTRADGVEVRGYWRGKPGRSCSLVGPGDSSSGTVRSPKTSKQTYVGPRGGRYHYSKNGRKVYEHR